MLMKNDIMKNATIPGKLRVKRHKRGYIHVFTGDGEGKTTSALGIALRSLGHDKEVVMIEFMKGRQGLGECKLEKRLQGFKVFQFGKVGWVSYKKPSGADKRRAKKGLDFAKKLLSGSSPPHVLILDEINLACSLGLIDSKELLDLLKRAPEKTDIFLTGRSAPKELVAFADFVTEMIEIKRKKVPARQGIEY
jgi:cob(I)alamin adenosyltransferase